MDTVNAVLTTFADWLLVPFARWPPVVVLVLVSAACGVGIAWIYGRTSNQAELRRAADRGKAQLLGMRLFNNEARVVLRYQAALLRSVGLRLWYALPPLLVLMVPVGIVLVQLAVRFEHRPLAPDETAVVELLSDEPGWDAARDASIQAPPGVVVETPAVRDAGSHSVLWRIRLDGAGAGAGGGAPTLRWALPGQTVTKALATDGARLTRVAARRPGRGIADRLLNPAEAAVPAGSPLRAIVVHYPPRATPILGLDVPWWATFLIVSMLSALVAGPFLRVRF